MQKVRFWDPEHWRFRAEETRTVADQMTHEEARTIMRRIANDYDRQRHLAQFSSLTFRRDIHIAMKPASPIIRLAMSA
jgi:hypothetical protein